MTVQDKIISLLENFIEKDDNEAMIHALSLFKTANVDLSGLLLHLENFKGDLPRKRRAIMLVRKQLGLSIIPGPVCRRNP